MPEMKPLAQDLGSESRSGDWRLFGVSVYGLLNI